MEEKTCYMCNEIATSREHVPPLCLFPEAKDVLGKNLRNDLITVPSCDRHNSSKSKDDEFLMVSIAGVVGNNFLGYLHTQTKIDRALRRKSKDFLSKEIVRNFKLKVINKSGRKYPILQGNPNYDRLVVCFEHIAYGLYLHEFGHKFKGNIRMLLGFISYDDENINTMIAMVKEKILVDEVKQEEKGKNPSVFKYKFLEPDKNGLVALVMTFYKGTEIFVALQPFGFEEPYDLSMELIHSGIKTFVEVGDKTFVFNTKAANIH